jgi:hypothetical protein
VPSLGCALEIVQSEHVIRPNRGWLRHLGFDEYVVLEASEGPYGHSRDVELRYGIDASALCYPTESLYRDRASGAWYAFDGLVGKSNDQLQFFGKPIEQNQRFRVDEWTGRLRALVDVPDPEPHVLWLADRWTPRAQNEQRKALRMP